MYILLQHQLIRILIMFLDIGVPFDIIIMLVVLEVKTRYLAATHIHLLIAIITMMRLELHA